MPSSVSAVAPQTPVLVGVGVAARPPQAGAEPVSAVELMTAATEAAAGDASPAAASPAGLLGLVSRVYVPRGSWDDVDPGREIARRVGLGTAGGGEVRTALAELGVLQQTLITRACQDIAAGRAQAVLVVGAEAAHRTGPVRMRLVGGSGTAAPSDAGPVREPDERLVPDGDILVRLEISRGAYLPVRQYALLETALRAADGLAVDRHAAEVAELWAAFSRVAAGNEHAWARAEVAPADLGPSARNPMMSWPYTRSHCSRAGVNQAAALLLCSADAARRLGVPRERWVFPVAAVESNAMVPVTARPELARSPGFAAVGERLTALAGVAPADVDLLDLYSCFPAAVRLQVRELGLAGRPAGELTVTGGMTFAGGPLNNYVFQSTAAMARRLREAASGSRGLVTCISGMVTKQAGLLWSTEPAAAGFRAEDVTATVRAREVPLELVDPDADGPVLTGRVAGYTVACASGEPERAIAVVSLDGGGRTVVTSTSADVMTAMTTEEWVGRSVKLRADTLLP
ncbi:MAG: acetyl-CoA acetyltransferase [Frankia sp.]|nr:acetyl-CoA acetyltransferase [Frankia sp.]